VAKGQLVLARRIPEGEERKQFLPEAEVLETLPARLEAYPALPLRAGPRAARGQLPPRRGIVRAAEGDHGGPGGFVYAGWCGAGACEERVKEETKATIRCLPLEEFRSETAPERCLVCGGPAEHEAVWAKAY
jgi:hypothetical protein